MIPSVFAAKSLSLVSGQTQPGIEHVNALDSQNLGSLLELELFGDALVGGAPDSAAVVAHRFSESKKVVGNMS